MASLILGIFGLAAYTSIVWFQAFPFIQDEYTYLYQAEIFASGRLALKASEAIRVFVEPCMVLIDGQLFSKYAPGFSALLSLGVLAGQPALVNPTLAALCCVVLYVLLVRMVGHSVGILTLMFLGSSPLFLAYSASFFAHPLSLLLCACGFLNAILYLDVPRRRYVIGIGASAGALCLVRPLDALCLAIVLGGAVLVSASRAVRLQHMVQMAACMAAGALCLLIHNYIMTGDWTIAVYPIWQNEFQVVDPEATGWWDNMRRVTTAYGQALYWYTWSGFIYYYVPYLGWGLVVMAVAGVMVAPRRITMICICFSLLIILGYTFHRTLGYPLYGNRYWYPTLVPLVMLAAYGVAYLYTRRNKIIVAVLLFWAAAAQLLGAIHLMQEYATRFEALKDIQESIDEQCPSPSIVVLNRDGGRPAGWPSFVGNNLLRRNAFLSGERLYVSNMEDAHTGQRAFPTYSICDFHYRLTVRP